MDSLPQFTRKFATVEACLAHLEAVRWPDGPYCPHCGGDARIYHYSDGRRHKCGECRRVFRIITGTIFSDSPIRMLPKWFAAIWLDTCHARGISSVQLAKDIGVTQKTAWHMLQRIRHAGGDGDSGMPGDTVEAGEILIGGRKKKGRAGKATKGARGRSVKTGLAERGEHAHLLPAGGAAYASGIESFRTLVKRAHAGIRHYWSRKHIRRHPDGRGFRMNMKNVVRDNRAARLIEGDPSAGHACGGLIA